MQNKKNFLKLLITLLILILIILIVIVYKKSVEQSKRFIGETQEETNEKILNNIEAIELADKTEIERMKSYISTFLKNIEYEKYEEAYKLLNNDFKINYFASCDDFKNYFNGKTSGMISIKYDNYERIGDLYVFWVKISNPITQGKNEGTELNFVVKENALNDFELSFSVI